MSFSITAKQKVSSIVPVRSPNLRSRIFLALTLGSLSIPSFLGSVAVAKPISPSMLAAEQKLDRMFSPNIQATLNACLKQGGVNLAAGADRDGSIVCGNGWRKSPVKFTSYVNTLTDIQTASLLLGLQAGVKSNSNYTPELFTKLMTSLETSGKLRQTVQSAIVAEADKSGLLPKGSTQSASFLTERILQRSRPFFQNSTKFANLLGTSNEYTVITDNFCTAPGMMTTQAKKLAPNLDPVQIFAICLQEAGVSEAFTQEIRRSNPSARR
ncbi:MAG: hypothetical protein LH660_20215 [Phormidesmis sp. CAN_BIN36]|nr:hypothetical protein [Phormidesmis sp. CAN_BIN36]